MRRFSVFIDGWEHLKPRTPFCRSIYYPSLPAESWPPPSKGIINCRESAAAKSVFKHLCSLVRCLSSCRLKTWITASCVAVEESVDGNQGVEKRRRSPSRFGSIQSSNAVSRKFNVFRYASRVKVMLLHIIWLQMESFNYWWSNRKAIKGPILC